MDKKNVMQIRLSTENKCLFFLERVISKLKKNQQTPCLEICITMANFPEFNQAIYLKTIFLILQFTFPKREFWLRGGCSLKPQHLSPRGSGVK